MTRLAVLTAAAICSAVAAYAANEALSSDGPTVIEIEVAPNELAACKAQLKQVGSMPAVADDGTPLLFGGNDDLPQVRCVADTV
ncbi:hypothetical protein AYJ57_04180 [Salipiger sp. CCB-MM3]|uniref:hypothetical protein n=1 Tax=Roseobacteraceae TaxID=2854170 RepID=UPI00080AAB93|nr:MULTISPECIES: hypothetical protein [Roseobacteraceae]ANT59632.1 hypothetical protein AYJ57_04180 [Salipiger sp. CCB-MM3]MCA0998373.1 hypothetical protein [Alloyangia pacifica]